MRLMTRALMCVLALIGFLPSLAAAQTAPATPAPAPTSAADDTPTIRVGTTIFTDYTYATSPKSTNADGASFHYASKSGYAELHAGVYNGENYNKAEANDQKALMARGTVRPFAKQSGAIKNLRLTAFYDHDAYVKDAERTRFIGAATFEHRFPNAAVEYLATGDRARAAVGLVEGPGYSVGITPKRTHGWEGLLRFDHNKPDDSLTTVRQRTI